MIFREQKSVNKIEEKSLQEEHKKIQISFLGPIGALQTCLIFSIAVHGS